MIQGKLRKRWLAMIALLFAMTLTPPVFAQDEATPAAGESNAQVQIGLRGDGQLDGERVTVEAAPGDTKTVKIVISNLGNASLGLVSYTADIGTRINGNLAMAQQDSEQHAPTTWLDYSSDEFTLDPQTETTREGTISVPADAAPGEYVIPIAAETTDSFAVAGTNQIRQKVRKILTVYVVVSGDYAVDFQLGDPRIEIIESGPAIQIPLTNISQATLRLTGELTVFDPSGQPAFSAPIKMGVVYPKTETIVQWRLDSYLPAGEYTVTFELTESGSGVTRSFENASMTAPEPPSTETAPLAFGTILIAPNADPIQFAGVGVEIVNNGDLIRSTRLTLIVTKDGAPLEDFVIADNFTLEQGTTTATQRYIPLDGWASGSEYGFSLKLESIDTGTGTATPLLESDNVATIKVP
jgi:hypothetical protein